MSAPRVEPGASRIEPGAPRVEPSAPRIEPGALREVSPLAWAIAHLGGRSAGTEPLKLFTTLGRHRSLFRAWLWFAGHLMPGGRLKRRESELVILRVATLRRCAYEHAHHVRIARRAGLSKAQIECIADWQAAEGYSPRERAILAAVDAMHASGDIDEPTWDALRAHLDERECIELTMLAGHYEMLATVITALRIAPDSKRPR